jgi:hypothetical protein
MATTRRPRTSFNSTIAESGRPYPRGQFGVFGLSRLCVYFPTMTKRAKYFADLEHPYHLIQQHRGQKTKLSHILYAEHKLENCSLCDTFVTLKCAPIPRRFPFPAISLTPLFHRFPNPTSLQNYIRSPIPILRRFLPNTNKPGLLKNPQARSIVLQGSHIHEHSPAFIQFTALQSLRICFPISTEKSGKRFSEVPFVPVGRRDFIADASNRRPRHEP